MKKQIKIISISSILLWITSCSSLQITKRHYRDGFYVDKIVNKNTSAIEKDSPIAMVYSTTELIERNNDFNDDERSMELSSSMDNEIATINKKLTLDITSHKLANNLWKRNNSYIKTQSNNPKKVSNDKLKTEPFGMVSFICLFAGVFYALLLGWGSSLLLYLIFPILTAVFGIISLVRINKKPTVFTGKIFPLIALWLLFLGGFCILLAALNMPKVSYP